MKISRGVKESETRTILMVQQVTAGGKKLNKKGRESTGFPTRSWICGARRTRFGSARWFVQPFQAVRGRQPERNSLSRLWVRQINFHSALTLSRPRRRKRRNPRHSLIWPKTGSTIALRIL